MGLPRTSAIALVAVLAVPAMAGAQCSTEDLDSNGIPDVCPVGSSYTAGTNGNDIISGTNGVDCIFAFGGDDSIEGLGGDDYICAGDGNDTVVAGGGNDRVFGEGGDDTIDGGNNNDILFGGSGNDTLTGGNGNDTLSGEDGNDALDGGNGGDALSGGPGTDTLDGNGGTDSCVEEVPGTSERLQSCEVTTYAAVDSFDAVRTDRGVTVTWETTTEVGVVSFRLWRREDNGALSWVGEVAAAADGSPHGASYFVRDESAPRDGAVEYVLEERTVSGGSVSYGPFVTTPVLVDAGHPRMQGRASAGRTPRRVPLERLTRPEIGQRSSVWSRKSAEAPFGVEIVVDRPGVIEVDAGAIADALKVSAGAIESLIRSGGLSLRLGDDSIAWRAARNGAALRFVSNEVVTPFANQRRYLLSVGDGVTMETRTLVGEGFVEPHTFLETKRFEENVFPGPMGSPDPRLDLFFWHALSSAAQAVIPVSLPGLSASQARELRVHVHCATEHPDQPHRVELHWNGQSLGVFDLLGRRRHTIRVPLEGFPAAVDNELVVEQHVAGEAPPVLFTDAVEVDYLRLAEADAPVFRFGGAEGGPHSVSGLSSDTVDLYDVSDPRAPKHYGELMLDEPGRLSFVASGSDLRFLVAAPQAVAAPIEVRPRFATSLRSPHHSVDYVIVAASHLLNDAQALADLREADGYRVLVVDVDDVYWEFAHGEPDPLAIRDLLSFAWQHWETAPRFALLVGKGTLDYRDLLGLGGNWLPPALAPTEGGLFPSDSMLGDVVGDDGVPEIAVGRLPITTAEDLVRTIHAIETFEADHQASLFAADDSERGEFIAASRLLSARLPSAHVEEIDLNAELLEDARARLFASWEGELGWVSYVGHGGLDRLATEGLLTSADVPGLVDRGRTPVVLGWSCNIARFDIPGFFSLGERLLTAGASAGVFSATGWSNHVETDALRTAFVEAAFASDAETLGEAVVRAHQSAADAPLELHRVYALLGDPALRLRLPKAIPDPEPEVEPPVDDNSPEPDPGSGIGGDPSATPSEGSGCGVARSSATGASVDTSFSLLGLALAIGLSRCSRRRRRSRRSASFLRRLPR